MNCKTLITLLAVFPLVACSSVIQPWPIPPASLTQPCEEIRRLPDNANMGDLLEADIELIGQYRECSLKHKSLADWTKNR